MSPWSLYSHVKNHVRAWSIITLINNKSLGVVGEDDRYRENIYSRNLQRSNFAKYNDLKISQYTVLFSNCYYGGFYYYTYTCTLSLWGVDIWFTCTQLIYSHSYIINSVFQWFQSLITIYVMYLNDYTRSAWRKYTCFVYLHSIVSNKDF